MFLQSPSNPYSTYINTDLNGNPVDVTISNEPHIVYDCKFILAQIPDEQFRIQIDGMYEQNINAELKDATMFKVDYVNGVIYTHSSKEKTSITVKQYKGRGFVCLNSSRIFIETNSSWSSGSLNDLISAQKLYIDSIRDNLQTQITTNNTNIITALNNHLNSTTAHLAENISYSGNIVGATNVKQGLDSLQLQVNSITASGSIDPQVSQALVDVENVTHATLKAKDDSWELRIKENEKKLNTPEYSTPDPVIAPVWSLSNSVRAPFKKFLVRARTYHNLLESDGDFGNSGTSSWYQEGDSVLSQSNNELTVTKNTSGSNTYFNANHNVTLIAGKYYLLLAEVKFTNTSSASIRCVRTTDWAWSTSNPCTLSSTYSIASVKFYPTQTGNHLIGIEGGVTTASTAGAYTIKKFRLIEITEDEYNNVTLNELPQRYPYINGTTGTNPLEIKIVGSNLYDGTPMLPYRIGESTIPDSNRASTDYMRILPNTSYKAIPETTIVNLFIDWFDNNKKFISSAFQYQASYVIGISPSNASYATVYYYQENAPRNKKLIFGESSKVTTYEPYQESVTYINTESNSLPNGVCDIDDVVKGIYTKNTGVKLLQSSDVISIQDDTNVTYAIVSKPSDYAGYGKSTLYDTLIEGKIESGSLPSDVSHIGYYGTNVAQFNIYISYSKGTTLAQAQADLAGKKIIYQLAKPIVSQHESGLTSFENGTVSITPRVKFITKPVGGVITVPQDLQQWGIKFVVSVKKVVDGIASEKADVSSFTATTVTISNPDNTAMYEVVYDYEGSTIPEVVYSYAINRGAQGDMTAAQVNKLTNDVNDITDLISVLIVMSN